VILCDICINYCTFCRPVCPHPSLCCIFSPFLLNVMFFPPCLYYVGYVWRVSKRNLSSYRVLLLQGNTAFTCTAQSHLEGSDLLTVIAMPRRVREVAVPPTQHLSEVSLCLHQHAHLYLSPQPLHSYCTVLNAALMFDRNRCLSYERRVVGSVNVLNNCDALKGFVLFIKLCHAYEGGF
jgi:hypothetical protein